MKEHGLKHFRVLVADDDSSILDLFQQILSPVKTNSIVHLEAEESEGNHAVRQPSLSFDLITCQQGEETVDAVRNAIHEDRPFSVAFIDIRMPPGPYGIWTAEHIRALDPNIEIIIVTGYSDIHPRDIARRVPPTHKLLYLQKPFHSREIYQFASALSMKWHTERELQRLNKGLEKCVEDRTKELRESEKRFKNFLGNLGDIAYEIDSSGNTTYANKMAEIITGVPLKDIIGKPFFPLFTEESQAIAIDVYQRTLKGESPEFDLTFTNGRICRYKNKPLRDKDGKIVGVFGIARDITDRKRREKALRESEERFRMIFTNSTDGIIVADPATEKFIYVNPAICKTLDYTEKELTQMSVVDIHPKNSLEHVVSEFEAQARGEKLLAMNIPFLKKDGTIIYMDINASIVKMDEKHRIMGIFRDISERVKAEEALKKAHDELEHRVKERTFELNNALKTIKRSEKELTQRKFALEKLNRELIETNQALSILARNIDRDKALLEKKIYEITSTNIIPIINELQDDKGCQKRLADLELLKTYLNSLIPGPTDQHKIVVYLSSQEMRVAAMIKRGLTSPKIAEMLNVSLHTLKTHRKNIRKKLKLQNSNINLCSYLRSKMVSDSM